jgi:Mg-chelatase subunit ChlD
MTQRDSSIRSIAEILVEAPPDPATAAAMRLIAGNLAVRRRHRQYRRDVARGELTSARYRYHSADIDLDRTLAVLTQNPRPDDTDLIVRERNRSPRAVVFVVDVSGSMKGEKARMAAATIGALAAEFRDDQVAVVAFWSDAALLKPLDQPMPVQELLDQLTRLPTRGLTNVAFGLDVATTELARTGARRRMVVLLTDALHNAGPDPRDLAFRIPELHVLAQVDGPHDLPLAVDLARAGHGRLATVRTYRDVAPALNRLLAD